MGDRASRSIYTLCKKMSDLVVVAFPGTILIYQISGNNLHETYRFVGHPLFPVNLIKCRQHTEPTMHICFQHMNDIYHVDMTGMAYPGYQARTNGPDRLLLYNALVYIDLPQTLRWVYDETRSITESWKNGILTYSDSFLGVEPASFDGNVTTLSEEVGT